MSFLNKIFKSYSDKEVTGTVDNDSDGILFLSIPEHTNWDVYVDGEKLFEAHIGMSYENIKDEVRRVLDAALA